MTAEPQPPVVLEPPIELSPRQRALRVAALNVVADLVAAAKVTERGALDAQMERDESDAVHAKLADGTKVATVSRSAGGEDTTTFTVLSEAQLVTYVKSIAPSEVVETIRPAFYKLLQERLVLTEDDEVVDSATGTPIDGVIGRRGKSTAGMRVTFAKGGKELLAAALADDASLLSSIVSTPPPALPAGSGSGGE